MSNRSSLGRPALFLLLLLSVTLVLAGCAQDSENSSLGDSALPWNRPASWEGGGALGSQMNSMNH